jgi:hypothetical protein
MVGVGGFEPPASCSQSRNKRDFEIRVTKAKVANIRMVKRYYDLSLVESSFLLFRPFTGTEREWNFRDFTQDPDGGVLLDRGTMKALAA